MVLTCPNCGTRPPAAKQRADDTHHCPSCGKVLNVSADPTLALEPSARISDAKVAALSVPPAAKPTPAAATVDVPALSPDLTRNWDAPATWVASHAAACPVVTGYDILSELGRGGMGVVYKARHQKLNRVVALKMILAGAHAGEQELVRFLAEAEAVAKLQHPNIVQLYDFGQHDGLPYFTLEYVAGGSLHAQLSTSILPAIEAARLVEQLAEGIHHAHRHGIIHRDLKPHNVLMQVADGDLHRAELDTYVTAGDRPAASKVTNSQPSLTVPKITDFGLVKKVEVGSGLTASGAIMGTPSYMAPEQASGDTKRVGPAADVYALGAILYECLTGRPPFQANTPLDTVLQVISSEPRPPTQLNPKMPRDLETICLKCLHKEPSRRYTDAEALAADLRRFQAGEPILARPVGRVERTVKWVRRHPAATAFWAAVLLLVVGMATAAGWYHLIQVERHQQLNQDVAAALAETEALRADLQRQLSDPLKLAVLLSDLKQWETALQTLQTSWQRAQKLADSNPALLDTESRIRLEQLAQQVPAEEKTYQVAANLDAIRLEAATLAESMLRPAAVELKYENVFLKELGLDVRQSSASELAAQVRQAALRYVLVAALDHWADLTDDNDLRLRLLEVSRLADPDPWRDQIRDAKAWQTLPTLKQLAKTIEFKQHSPQIVSLLAQRLKAQGGQKAAAALVRAALLHEQKDFWLQFELGNLATIPADRAGPLQAALLIRPDCAPVHSALGTALHGKKDFAAAVEHYQKALKLDPKYAVAYVGLGNVRTDQKDLKAAVEQYQAALDLNPDFALAHLCLGLLRQIQKDNAGASACFKKALAADPQLGNTFASLGRDLQAQKDYVAASACFQKAVALMPNSAPLHFDLGMVLHQKKDYNAAIVSFKKVVALDSKHKAAFVEWGWCLDEGSNDLNGALGRYQKALDIDPKYAAAYYSTGWAKYRQKKNAEAMVWLQKALDIDPAFSLAHFGLGMAHVQQAQKSQFKLPDLQRDYTEAIASFKKALAINPNLPQARGELAHTYHKLGEVMTKKKDLDQAQVNFQAAVALNPNNAWFQNLLGQVLCAQGDFEAGIAHLQTAVALHGGKDPPASHSDLAHALKAKGDLDGAIEYYTKALQLGQFGPSTRFELGNAYLAQGRLEDAKKFTEMALKGIGTSGKDLLFRPAVEKQLARCEQLLVLDKKLAAVLSGDGQARTPAEQLALADLCHNYKQLYATAAKLYAAALPVAADLTDEQMQHHRYQAACAAVLAAAGQGKETAKLEPKQQTAFRQQALKLMQADLDRARQAKRGPAKTLAGLVQELGRWHTDPALASVRDKQELAKLPQEEQQTWQNFWSEAGTLYTEVKANFRIVEKRQGCLNGVHAGNTHKVKLKAGKMYVIDLQCKQFEVRLSLINNQGTMLVSAKSGNLNARLFYTAKQDGDYGILVGSSYPQMRGAYTLTVREFTVASK